MAMGKFFNERGNEFYRFLDRYLGIPLIAVGGLIRWQPGTIPSSINRIGIFKSSAIGDTVLLDGISKDLRKAWPLAQLVFFAGRDNYQMAEMLEQVDEVVLLQMNRPFDAAKRIYKAGHFDLWLDFSQWARIDALLTALAQADCKIGFRTSNQFRHWLYDKWVEHRADLHETNNYKNLVELMGIECSSEPHIKAASDLSKILPELKANRPYSVLHLFPGGSRAYMKEWPVQNWLKVARHILKMGMVPVLTGGPDDFNRAEEFSSKLGINIPIVNSAGRLSLPELATLLGEAKFVISVNTGVMHMAAAVGAKLIAIHGPTSPIRWGPVSKEAVVIKPPEIVKCAPCLNLGFEYKCERNTCLKEISSEVVIYAITGLLRS